MTQPEPPKDRVLVAVDDNTALAKITGRGSFKVSAPVKDFCATLPAAGVNRLIIDLEDCIGMDSTFMGVIAGVCNRFRKEVDGRVVMTHVSDKIKRLMSTLGLDRLVELSDDPEVAALPAARMDELVSKDQTPLESAETMLEAHENLVEAHQENLPRFQDVLDYLREDIQRQRHP